ncbi:MAG: PilT/PilU family type 4a pilus ATPase, partial [Proteobacteria bacterium]|nr:PilT/PilU family type 4a pilus ATPase [Pseudomonadota bacterium]
METDIAAYLSLMVRKGAADLFCTVGAPVSLSIDGKILPVGHDVLDSQTNRAMIYSILSDDQIREFEENFELNMGISYQGIGRFRVNVYRQRGEVAMVVRHVKDQIPAFAELGLPDILKQIVMEKSGLVLVVGATGSGKSTTLASMIDYRNSNDRGHIITIENPIEFVHEHKKSLVDQREVGLDTRSYNQALENVLREAPNVIVIGEIRDKEGMKHAVHYAETGHLCLSTLHASNSFQAFERILNFFEPSAHHALLGDLSQHLRAIIAQRLVKMPGCGRTAAVEVLLNSPYISDLIAEGEIGQIHDAMERAETDGMQTFDHALYNLVHDGRIEPA